MGESGHGGTSFILNLSVITLKLSSREIHRVYA